MLLQTKTDELTAENPLLLKIRSKVRTYDDLIKFYHHKCPDRARMVTLPALLKVLQRGGRTMDFLARMFVPDFGFVPPDGAAAKGMLGIRAFLKEYDHNSVSNSLLIVFPTEQLKATALLMMTMMCTMC